MNDSGHPRPLTRPPVPDPPRAQPHSTDDPAQGAGDPELVDLTPDAPTVENAAGGKQSRLSYRVDLIDAEAILREAAILHEGAVKHGVNNWRNIPPEDHLNHLLVHVFAWLSGDRQDDHLGHAMCRARFAFATEATRRHGPAELGPSLEGERP